VFVDNSTTPATFWVGNNHGASIVRLEPLDAPAARTQVQAQAPEKQSSYVAFGSNRDRLWRVMRSFLDMPPRRDSVGQ
jgi:hypothetical protein